MKLFACYLWKFTFLAPFTKRCKLGGHLCCHIHPCNLSDHLSTLHKVERKTERQSMRSSIARSRINQLCFSNKQSPQIFPKTRFSFSEFTFPPCRLIGAQLPRHLHFGTLAKGAAVAPLLTVSWKTDEDTPTLKVVAS